jgi:uncharacterized protein YjbJ (UPF0337 family)
VINKDIILGKWKEIAGEIQNKWGSISENELQKVKGNVTALVGLVQQKFGVSKEEAEKKVEELLAKYNKQEIKDKLEVTAGKVLETANTLLDVVKEKLNQNKKQ